MRATRKKKVEIQGDRHEAFDISNVVTRVKKTRKSSFNHKGEERQRWGRSRIALVRGANQIKTRSREEKKKGKKMLFNRKKRIGETVQIPTAHGDEGKKGGKHSLAD